MKKLVVKKKKKINKHLNKTHKNHTGNYLFFAINCAIVCSGTNSHNVKQNVCNADMSLMYKFSYYIYIMCIIVCIICAVKKRLMVAF